MDVKSADYFILGFKEYRGNSGVAIAMIQKEIFIHMLVYNLSNYIKVNF